MSKKQHELKLGPKAVIQKNIPENLNEESNDNEYTIYAICDHKVVISGEFEYRIRWFNYGPNDDTWEPEKNLYSCLDLLAEYKAKHNIVDSGARCQLQFHLRQAVKSLEESPGITPTDCEKGRIATRSISKASSPALVPLPSDELVFGCSVNRPKTPSRTGNRRIASKRSATPSSTSSLRGILASEERQIVTRRAKSFHLSASVGHTLEPHHEAAPNKQEENVDSQIITRAQSFHLSSSDNHSPPQHPSSVTIKQEASVDRSTSRVSTRSGFRQIFKNSLSVSVKLETATSVSLPGQLCSSNRSYSLRSSSPLPKRIKVESPALSTTDSEEKVTVEFLVNNDNLPFLAEHRSNSVDAVSNAETDLDNDSSPPGTFSAIDSRTHTVDTTVCADQDVEASVVRLEQDTEANNDDKTDCENSAEELESLSSSGEQFSSCIQAASTSTDSLGTLSLSTSSDFIAASAVDSSNSTVPHSNDNSEQSVSPCCDDGRTQQNSSSESLNENLSESNEFTLVAVDLSCEAVSHAQGDYAPSAGLPSTQQELLSDDTVLDITYPETDTSCTLQNLEQSEEREIHVSPVIPIEESSSQGDAFLETEVRVLLESLVTSVAAKETEPTEWAREDLLEQGTLDIDFGCSTEECVVSAEACEVEGFVGNVEAVKVSNTYSSSLEISDSSACVSCELPSDIEHPHCSKTQACDKDNTGYLLTLVDPLRCLDPVPMGLAQSCRDTTSDVFTDGAIFSEPCSSSGTTAHDQRTWESDMDCIAASDLITEISEPDSTVVSSTLMETAELAPLVVETSSAVSFDQSCPDDNREDKVELYNVLCNVLERLLQQHESNETFKAKLLSQRHSLPLPQCDLNESFLLVAINERRAREVFETLLKSDNVNAKLSAAVKLGKLDIVAQLFECGATKDTPDVDQTDENGVNLLMMCAMKRCKNKKHNYCGIVKLLIERGAFVTQVSRNSGYSCLHIASHIMLLALWAAYGGDINCTNNLGETPLHCAAQCGNTAAVMQFLSHGADLSKENARGETALHLSKPYVDTFKLLHNFGSRLFLSTSTVGRRCLGNIAELVNPLSPTHTFAVKPCSVCKFSFRHEQSKLTGGRMVLFLTIAGYFANGNDDMSELTPVPSLARHPVMAVVVDNVKQEPLVDTRCVWTMQSEKSDKACWYIELHIGDDFRDSSFANIFIVAQPWIISVKRTWSK